MGGRGSGNFYRWDVRDTTADYNRLDIRSIHRTGLLRPGFTGTSRWFRGEQQTGCIGWIVRGAGQRATELVLEYRMGDEPLMSYPVPLDWTPCHYGGARPWFRCPGCGRRVAILYGGRLFRCRHCYGLAYQSTREDASLRLMYKAQAIRERLGGRDSSHNRYPSKPKGMHWTTYDRLCSDALDAEMASWGALAERFGLLDT